MLKWLSIVVRTLMSAMRTHRALTIENLVLRQQVAVLKKSNPRPRLTDADRVFWAALSSLWSDWRESLQMVRPETVLRWHRHGFRYYWRWKSRGWGHPKIDPEIRLLIRRMCRANPLWGAPRIHGELLKLGVEVSESTVSKYMPDTAGRRLRLGGHFLRVTPKKLSPLISSLCRRRLSEFCLCLLC